MAVKVGDEFLTLDVMEDGRLEWSFHVVRTIRGGWVHVIQKNALTWGKRSKRHGDFGWFDNIPAWCRARWRVGGERPDYLAKTRLQAVRHAIRFHKDHESPEDFESPEIFENVLPRLKRLQARYSKAGKAKRAGKDKGG